MTKRKHNVKKDIPVRKTKGRTKLKGHIKKMDKSEIKLRDIEKISPIKDIETIVPERKVKMTPVSRDVSKDLTVSIGDVEGHRAISKSTDVDLSIKDGVVKKKKAPIPVMYGAQSIPPGPYNHEDTLKYMEYALRTASSADNQQIAKLLEILHYLLDNTIYQE